MYARPAGMSDEESDEEGFEFHDEVNYNGYSRNEITANGQINFDVSPNTESEKHNLEFRAYQACLSGSKSIIDNYLESGGEVNAFLHTGWTLLLYAASAAQTQLVKYLLELGADPNLQSDGYTPLMALSNCPREEGENCLECLKILLEYKANTHATNKRRETALMIACKMREADFVRELVQNMRSVNGADSENQTAIFFAVKANKYEIVQILLDANADATVKDRFDATPYDIAKTKGFDKIAALLDDEENDEAPINEEIDILDWKSMFPAIATKNDDKLNFEISTILYGMGLDKYKELFRGMDLKTFLKLTEEDLEKLGIDTSAHRKRFIKDLHRFHTKMWDVKTLGVMKRNLPYSIYDGVITLGNAAKQISIVGSSFRFIVNSLMKGKQENISLSPLQKIEYSSELQKTENSLIVLKRELLLVKKLAEKIDKETEITVPATYIAKKKRTYKWTIILSISAMFGIYLSKSKLAKLWDL